MIELFERHLDELLNPNRHPPGLLIESARYATLGGGKRIRPQLLMAVTLLNSPTITPSLVPACAIEMIHTYSLIHDDLPCMDDDDFRRGKPSLHKVYNEGQALLTGNFLLTYAFELLSTAPNLNSDQKLQIIQTVSRSIGSWGMMGGQELDLRWNPHLATEETLQDLHRRKTGALIQASIECGLIIGQMEEPAPLKKLGVLLGDLYQLLDDLQDPQDIAKGRPTALALYGAEKTHQLAESLYQEALHLIRPWEGSELEKLLAFWDPEHVRC